MPLSLLLPVQCHRAVAVENPTLAQVLGLHSFIPGSYGMREIASMINAAAQAEVDEDTMSRSSSILLGLQVLFCVRHAVALQRGSQHSLLTFLDRCVLFSSVKDAALCQSDVFINVPMRPMKLDVTMKLRLLLIRRKMGRSPKYLLCASPWRDVSLTVLCRGTEGGEAAAEALWALVTTSIDNLELAKERVRFLASPFFFIAC